MADEAHHRKPVDEESSSKPEVEQKVTESAAGEMPIAQSEPDEHIVTQPAVEEKTIVQPAVDELRVAESAADELRVPQPAIEEIHATQSTTDKEIPPSGAYTPIGQPDVDGTSIVPGTVGAKTPAVRTKLGFRRRVSLALHPKPELARLDTGLRYTDILFGFVIREIFLRLQRWEQLDRYAWLYLFACLSLVLGSWIGYRRSLNRSSYEVKFFNLPFFRFLLDQGMLILYFQTVNSRTTDMTRPWMDANAAASLGTDPSNLAKDTVTLLVLVFTLYWLWDILGMRMAASKDSFGKARYPKVEDGKILEQRQPPDWSGFIITTVAFGFLVAVWVLLKNQVGWLTPIPTFISTVIILLGYRTLKEIRTSWREN